MPNLSVSSPFFLLLSIIFLISTAKPVISTSRIQIMCKNTSYPALCNQYLSIFPYSKTQNPKNLAKSALLASLYRAQFTRSYIFKVSRKLRAIRDRGIAGDCLEVLGDSVDSLCNSIVELNKLRGKGIKDENCDVRCHVSNIQNYLSSALTDASTCVDEFDELPMMMMKKKKKKMGKLMATVKAKALNVEQVTSVALDLFCLYVAKCA